MKCPQCDSPTDAFGDDKYLCPQCGGTFRFTPPLECPQCSGLAVRQDGWSTECWKCLSCQARGDIDDDGKPVPPGNMLALEEAVRQAGPGAGSLPLHAFPIPVFRKGGERLVAINDIGRLRTAAREKAEEFKQPKLEPEPEPPPPTYRISTEAAKDRAGLIGFHRQEIYRAARTVGVHIWRRGHAGEFMDSRNVGAVLSAIAESAR